MPLSFFSLPILLCASFSPAGLSTQNIAKQWSYTWYTQGKLYMWIIFRFFQHITFWDFYLVCVLNRWILFFLYYSIQRTYRSLHITVLLKVCVFLSTFHHFCMYGSERFFVILFFRCGKKRRELCESKGGTNIFLTQAPS